MEDQSRRPFHTPSRIPEEMESRIVAMRKKEPAVGALKLRQMLLNEGCVKPPSASTINEVFRRNGLITREASLNASPVKRFEKEAPNMMWQADHKGDFLLKDNQRCFPLSVLDDCTRHCLCADAKSGRTLEETKESFIQMFRVYGMPDSLLCDNGLPWGASQSGSITQFEVWLMDLGILTIHGRARHPQTQGKVERFNGSYKKERLAYYVPADMKDAQSTLDAYRDFYNHKRPHHALNLEVPAKSYRSSKKKYPEVYREWSYEPGTELRTIKATGYLTYGGRGYYLSEGLGDKQVSLVPSNADGRINIIYRKFRVGQIDLREGCIVSKRIYLLEGDPREKV